MNVKNTLISGAILGLLGVALGAFGAHALKPMLTASGRVETFELAVRYEFYSAFALLITGVLQNLFPSTMKRFAALSFLLGTLLFSGSLYAFCFTGISTFAMVTPFGGLLLIAGWVLLLLGIIKQVK